MACLAHCEYQITLNVNGMELFILYISHTYKDLSLKGRAKAAVCECSLKEALE